MSMVKEQEHAISDDCNNMGMMLYTSEPTDVANMKKTISDLKDLVKTVPEVMYSFYHLFMHRPKPEVLATFTQQVQESVKSLETLVNQIQFLFVQ